VWGGPPQSWPHPGCDLGFLKRAFDLKKKKTRL
jgi:hypothetical protein